MTACAARLGLCRCELEWAHSISSAWPKPTHRCHCGCTWQTGDAGVQITPKPVRPAVRS